MAVAKNIVADTLIHTGKCVLMAAWASGTGTAGGNAIVYDSTSASGTKIITIRTPANTTIAVLPLTPIIMANGIYVDIDANINNATIQYEPRDS